MQRIKLLLAAICLGFLCLTYSVSAKGCKYQERKVEKGRKCRKSCKNDSDCAGGKKTCNCDDVCGKTCFNKDSPCDSNPEEIEHGMVRYDNITYGSKAIYSCEDGFKLDGNEQRTCRSDREWSGKPPTCLASACEYPSRVSSAFHDTASRHFDVGATVTYKCRHGYILSGNPNITCLSNKTWSSATFICIKVSCGEPEKPANGYFEAPNYFFGSWVTYHCDKGYDLANPGRARRYCSTTGTWSGNAATCQIRTCLPPVPPENGGAEARSRNFGDTVKYSCDQGYVLEGNAEGICDENSTWGVTPVCKVDINCRFEGSSRPLCGYTNAGVVLWERIFVEKNRDGLPTYSAIKRGAGEAIMRSPTIGDVTARCLKFYFYLETPLTSSENLRITLNNRRVAKIAPSGVRVPLGRWVGYQSSLLPTGKDTTFEIVVVGKEKIWIDDLEISNGPCKSRCEESNPCENGGRCVDEIESKYYCACDDRYTGSRCQREITCDRPSLENGRVTAPEKITFGTEVSFTCDDGFRLRGVSFARCTRTGLSQRIPQCKQDDEGQCPRGFGYVLGSTCYQYITTPRPYAEAEAICAVSGARLAVIQGQRVDRHLLDNTYKSERYYWTGLRTDNSVPGWSSGDKFEGVGDPKLIDLTNIGRSNCAAYHLRWRWSGRWWQWIWTIGFQNCRNRRQSICEAWTKSTRSYVVATKTRYSWLGIDGVYIPVPGLNTAYNKQAYRRDGQQPHVYLYFDFSQVLGRYRWVIGEYEIKNDTAGLIQAIAYTDAATPDKIKEDEWMDTSRYSLSIDIKENNKWGEWSEWTCDVSCGRGTEKRRRTCNDLEPQSLACKGKDFEERVCDLDPCRGSSSNEMNFDGKRYLLVQSNVDWKTAREDCLSRGMSIASAHTVNVQRALSVKIQQHLGEGLKVYWVDGFKSNQKWWNANREPLIIHEDTWNVGEPNGDPRSRDCLQIQKGGLNDHRCIERAKFICEKDLDGTCKDSQCTDGKVCRILQDGYECVCPSGTFGDDCLPIVSAVTSPPSGEVINTGTNPCSRNPCGSRGKCNNDEERGFTCFCFMGYTGELCETKTEESKESPCDPDPCNGGGTCRKEENDDGYACFCRSGNLGKYCEKRNACRITDISGEVLALKDGKVLDRFDAVSEGESVALECSKPDEDIVGEHSIKCIGAGVWNRNTKIACAPKQSLCTLKTSEDIFRIYFENDEEVTTLPVSIVSGSTLQLKCDADGERKSSVIRCNNGKWQSAIPNTCGGSSCDEFPPPDNGSMKVTPSDAAKPYQPGVKIEFSCNSYYLPTGATSTQCLEDGTWSNEPTSCQEVGCLLFHIELKKDVFVKGESDEKDIDAKVGDKYTLKCKKGEKKQRIECMGRDVWKPDYQTFSCN